MNDNELATILDLSENINVLKDLEATFERASIIEMKENAVNQMLRQCVKLGLYSNVTNIYEYALGELNRELNKNIAQYKNIEVRNV